MKKICLPIIFALSMLPTLFAQTSTVPADFVACLGKIVPQSRIAKLSASAPNGAQTIVEKIFVKRGDFVKVGQTIAELSGTIRANADVARAQAALKAIRTAADVKILQQKNLIADLEGAFAQNQKILDEKSPPRREREELEYEQGTLTRHIAQSKAMLPLIEASEAAHIEEGVCALEVSKAYASEFLVKSPIDGEIVELNIKRGEAVGMDGICEIADTSKMFVDAEVYVSDVSKIKIGSSAEVFSDALADKKFSGKVVEISNYVKGNKIYSSDPTDYSNLRVVVVKIALDKSEVFAKYIGSQVNVRISVK